jgi:hypothetical protein
MELLTEETVVDYLISNGLFTPDEKIEVEDGRKLINRT